MSAVFSIGPVFSMGSVLIGTERSPGAGVRARRLPEPSGHGSRGLISKVQHFAPPPPLSSSVVGTGIGA